MSEQNNMASQNKRKKPNRKASKQISFRVSESEYLELERSAKVLNISVAAFAKKKAQGARVVAPKIEAERAKEIARQLAAIGNNTNQMAKKMNRLEGVTPEQAEQLKHELNRMVNGLGEVWRQLT